MAHVRTLSPLARTVLFVALGALATYAVAGFRRHTIRREHWKQTDTQLDDRLDETMDCSDPIARY